MLITDLPPEIFMLILDRLGPSAFAIVVTTCKKFRYAALENRKLLLKKLRCVPGLKLGVDGFTNLKLLELFRKRASENLLNVQIMHDKHIFSFESTAISSIKASSSAISSIRTPNVALVCRDCPLVHLYNFCGHELVPVGVVDPLGACDHVWTPSDILKVAHSDLDGISILSRPAEACESMRLRKEVYVTHLWTTWKTGWRTSWGLVRTPEYRLRPDEMEAEFRAIAMKVARHGLFVISWKREDALGAAQLWSYNASKSERKHFVEGTGTPYNCEKIYEPPTSDDDYPATSITSLRFSPSPNAGWRDYRLDISRPGQFIPHAYLKLSEPGTNDNTYTPPVMYTTSVCLGDEEDDDDIEVTEDRPFFGRHTHENFVCNDHFLALGIYDANSLLILSGKMELNDEVCPKHADMTGWDRNNVTWSAAAQLAGYKRPDTSLHGVVAYSSDCRRIAIANWSNIHVWHIEPNQLIGERFHDEYYHHLRGQPCVVLFPAIIPAGSVVHQLAFGADDENVLWALTDNGLICYNIGPSCAGKVRHSTMVVGNTNKEVDDAPGYFVDGTKGGEGEEQYEVHRCRPHLD